MGMMLRGFLILVVGLAALALAGWLAIEKGRFLDGAQRAPGEVVALNAGGAHPQIRFDGPDGEAISYPQGGLIWGYREGMQVEVLFDPADPRRTAVINDMGAIWGVSMLFGGIGAVIFLGGLWTLWLARRKND